MDSDTTLNKTYQTLQTTTKDKTAPKKRKGRKIQPLNFSAVK